MRPPAKIRNWLKQDQMLEWLQEAGSKSVYQRRLAIWLTAVGRMHAHRIAEMLGVSTQSVWGWIKLYNNLGPVGLEPQRQGGRNRYYCSMEEEKQYLYTLLDYAEEGKLPSTQEIKAFWEKKLGRSVSNSYIYKLLKRHGWPDIFRDGDLNAEEDASFARQVQAWRRGGYGA